jgi:hypothetical protein
MEYHPVARSGTQHGARLNPIDARWPAGLRQAREKSHEDLAHALHVGQPAVAQMERQADMYASNLRRYVEALGGTLEITAHFPDTDVAITNFSDIAQAAELPGAISAASGIRQRHLYSWLCERWLNCHAKQ